MFVVIPPTNRQLRKCVHLGNKMYFGYINNIFVISIWLVCRYLFNNLLGRLSGVYTFKFDLAEGGGVKKQDLLQFTVKYCW